MEDKCVVQISDYRPHFCIKDVDGNYHVLPKALIDSIVEGNVDVSVLGESLISAILKDWMTTL